MSVDAHHVPGVWHEEVLSHMSWQQVEQDPLIVQLHLLHVVSLLLRLYTISSHATHERRRRGDSLQSDTNVETDVSKYNELFYSSSKLKGRCNCVSLSLEGDNVLLTRQTFTGILKIETYTSMIYWDCIRPCMQTHMQKICIISKYYRLKLNPKMFVCQSSEKTSLFPPRN